MSHEEFIAEVAKRLEWPENKTAGIIEVIREVISMELKMNNPVAIDEFGTLKNEICPEYILMIPETKERFLMPPSVEVVFNSLFRVDNDNPLLQADFTADDALYNELNISFSQFEPTILNEGVLFPGVQEIVAEAEEENNSSDYSTQPVDVQENDQIDEQPDLLELVVEDELEVQPEQVEDELEVQPAQVEDELEVQPAQVEDELEVQPAQVEDELEVQPAQVEDELEVQPAQVEYVEPLEQTTPVEEINPVGQTESLEEPLVGQTVYDDEKESFEHNESINELKSMEQEDLVKDQSEIEAVISSDAIPPEQTVSAGKGTLPPRTRTSRRLSNDKKRSPVWIPIAGGIAIILASLFFFKGVHNRKGRCG